MIEIVENDNDEYSLSGHTHTQKFSTGEPFCDAHTPVA
jgi:hypothetical protein